MECILCRIMLGLQEETKFYEDENFVVVRTKNLKGHQERMMIIYKKHITDAPHELQAEAFTILTVLAQRHFQFAERVYILDATYATIKTHWHKVMSDLRGEDMDQMMITGWTPIAIVKGLG